MKAVYRYFVFFVVISCLLTYTMYMKSNSLDTMEVKTKNCNKILNNEKGSFKNVDELPIVWNANNIDDRIVQQMKFVPKVDSTSIKRILISGSGSFDVPMGQKEFIKQECPVQNCDISEFEEKGVKYDARIFNMMATFSDLTNLNRDADQVWIIFILEGPLASPDYILTDSLFNWTASYRRDSTIVAPYEKWVSFGNKSSKVSKNYAAGKTKKCAIFVSNCDTTNKRLDYVKNLSEYIDVDIFGSCGQKQCSRSDENNCFDMLRKNYKFYLAFENSNCKDYITEKFFRNALMSDVLPVVMGAHPDEYARSSPPNSFIHVENFESPKELANYLHILDNDDKKYNEYFKWKGTGDFINTKFWCRLCALLNDPNKPTLTVKSLESWWRPPGVCIRSDQRWKE